MSADKELSCFACLFHSLHNLAYHVWMKTYLWFINTYKSSTLRIVNNCHKAEKTQCAI